jgi:hypothetical protein
MKVKVIVAKFGTYKEGDEIEMHESTAKAVAKHGKVELLDGDEPAKTKKKDK